jgi:ATP-dependent Clp endopeptidase proteolytic subunit ClpP
LRSTRRLQNLTSTLPKWYSIGNSVAGQPTQISIYDEIGMFGTSAGSFLADLKGVNGDIEVHVNSPGGDVFDGISIYNQLRQRPGSVHVIVDGLAASAASFIAQAASPGKLEMAPHSQMMIHNGFSMAIGDAADLRQTADLLDKITAEIAGIYAERSGKPVGYWLAKMSAESWFSDSEAVAEGLADNIHGQGKPANAWDLSVYGTAPGSAAAQPAPATAPAVPPAAVAPPRNADSGDGPVQIGDGWVQDPDGTTRFDPDDDGDDDSTPEGDTDHDYFDEDGKPIPGKTIPPKPGGTSNLSRFPLLDTADGSPWDAAKAWHNGAMSDDPAKFYAGICAGRRAGDPSNQSSWALPYKYHPGDAPNAAGVKAALSRLPQTDGLANADEAKATLQAAMKQVDPGYDPDALAVTPAVLAQVFTMPRATVDHSMWDPAAALAAAAAAEDPEAFYRGICAGRRPGDPATPQAWALPYRYAPSLPPNSSGVRAALAKISLIKDLANAGEARAELERAMREVSPEYCPDEIDPQLLAAALGLGLEGAGK